MMMVMIDDNHHNAVADDYSVYANLYIYIILDNRYDIIIYTYTHNIIIITIVCILAMVAVFEGF